MTRLMALGKLLWTAVVLSASAENPSNLATFPSQHWSRRDPAELGMEGASLDRLAEVLAGRGCVIKNGYVVKEWGDQSQRRDWASSAKPVLSTLLLFAIQEGKIPGPDTRVADLGWPLVPKDQTMTVAHLANMVGGYARPETPGSAWAYNDFAIQLYQKSLFDQVFKEDPDHVARTRFSELGLEDGLKFDPNRRRMSASVRDFARIAWFWMHQGQWNGKELLPRHLFERYQRPQVPVDLPISDDSETNDYLKIGSYGGGSNHFSKSGPGIYGFNWWFNGHGRTHPNSLTWPSAPRDTFMSIGAGGNCAVIIPSLELVLVAASANWGEFEPGNRQAPMNQILKLLVDANKPGGTTRTPESGSSERGTKKWRPIAITFAGPPTSEMADPNPFRDYRLTVSFTHRMKTVVVPGYYAADGQSADSGANAGNRWRVHFLPDEPGTWSYFASFVQGEGVATRLDPNAGEPIPFDGACGTFSVADPEPKGSPRFSKGLLRDVGERYFVFAETGEPFIKGGADSPENFLAFNDFDDTKPTHRYEPHAKDWRDDDPTWRDGKGKNIIGALNYLADHGVNCLYFLTMNVNGDGNDVWPWTSKEERFRFDVSKLDQWERVFQHMDRRGILLHVVHQEQENDQLLDGGDLGPERKLYYRELIARFAHHPSLVWNLGEETTNTTEQLRSFAQYINALDPYDHPIVVHTYPNQYEKVYAPLLGDRNISGASLQVAKAAHCAKVTETWLKRSAQSGRSWAVFIDEIGPAKIGVKPDSVDPDHDEVRIEALWKPLMVGGSGAEWLFGYDFPHNDINLEDFRSRERMWDQTHHAVMFFEQYFPLRKSTVAPDVLRAEQGLCLSSNLGSFAIYLPQGGSVTLNLPPALYGVHWYDPRNGGSLQAGKTTHLRGGAPAPLGEPPSEPEKDWVVLLRVEPTDKQDQN